jgi:transcriptional regulator with XRE-family HTH domain
MSPELLQASNRAFLAYVETIQKAKGLSVARLLRDANISETLVSNVKRKSPARRSPYISLGLILRLYQVYRVPFRTDELPELFK